MAITRVQTKGSGHAGSGGFAAITTTLTNAVTSGNLLVCWYFGNSSAGNATCSDNVNGTWNALTQQAILADGSGRRCNWFWVLTKSASAGSLTVTVSPNETSGNTETMQVAEYSGVGAIDTAVTAFASQTTFATSWTQASGTPSVTGDLILYGVAFDNDIGTHTISATSGITAVYAGGGGTSGGALAMAVGELLGASTLSVSCKMGIGSSDDGAKYVIGFRASSAGTKTQSAIARIATTPTKTQSAIARIAKNLTKTQSATANISGGSTVTKTQTAIARIANSKTKTQTAIARVANTVTKTQSAVARVANSKTKTQSAIARVANTVTKTQSAVARIAKNLTKTQSAIARIANSKTKTQSAIARIANSKTKTQTAIARVANSKTKTQSAVAHITGTVTKTQSATARIAKNLTKTQSAVARIAQSFTKTQSAIARVGQTGTKTQTAKAALTGTITKTQSATSRIANAKTKTQSARARISNQCFIQQGATARIIQNRYRFQPPVVDGRLRGHVLWEHFRPQPTGVTIIKENGVYRSVQLPSQPRLAAAEVVYLGGHEHYVSQSEAADLMAAGYDVEVITHD